MESTTTPIQKYLPLLPLSLQEQFLLFREAILAASTDIQESWKYKTLFYTYHGLFCYFSIETRNQRTYVGFCDGYLMEDPKHLLVSEGTKQIRKFYLDQPSNTSLELFKELLQEAIWVKDRMKSSRNLAIKSKKKRIL